MNQHRPNGDDIGGGCGSHERIFQQRAPESRAFLRLMDGKARQQHDPDGMIG